MRLPNFLIIANKRCGSSWLNHNLSSHPDVYMPPQKGLHFFDKNFDKGLNHYSVYFEDAGNERRIGETEHSYFWDDQVPERIFNSMGKIPMIISLRHPVDRAYSYYQLQMRKKNSSVTEFDFEKTFKSSMIHNYDMTAWGFYGQQLKKYLKYFPLEMFHIIHFEEINSQPLKTIQKVYDFLGVDFDFEPPLLHAKWTPASNVPEKTGELKVKILYTSSFARISRRVLKRIGFKNVKKFNVVSLPPIDSDVKKRFTRFYDDDIKLLMDLTQMDFSSWLSYKQ